MDLSMTGDRILCPQANMLTAMPCHFQYYTFNSFHEYVITIVECLLVWLLDSSFELTKWLKYEIQNKHQ